MDDLDRYQIQDLYERVERIEKSRTNETTYERFMHISFGLMALSASILMVGMVVAEIIAISMKFS